MLLLIQLGVCLAFIPTRSQCEAGFSRVLICGAAPQLVGPQSVLTQGVSPPQDAGHSVRPCCISWNFLLTHYSSWSGSVGGVQCIRHSSQFGVIRRLAEDSLHPSVQVIDEFAIC